MLSYHQAFHQLRNDLSEEYDAREAAAIAQEVMHHLSGWNRLQLLDFRDRLMDQEQCLLWSRFVEELKRGRPLQYVLGYAWFRGLQFKVDERVLIPRPETEELIQWILDERGSVTTGTALDIGTGSGCIPISLKLAMPLWEVETCDVSEGALELAGENAELLGVAITFRQLDILNRGHWLELPKYDILISNPPYIPLRERETLDLNVRAFEPGLALFTPDEDPLLFYRAIAEMGRSKLKEEGLIFCELHRDFAEATAEMFRSTGYQVILKADMHGNPRMLKAWFETSVE